MLQPVLDTLNDMLRRLEEMSPDEKTLTQVKHYAIHGSERFGATVLGTQILRRCFVLP